MNPDPPVTSTRILEKLIASLAYNTLILNDLAVNAAASGSPERGVLSQKPCETNFSRGQSYGRVRRDPVLSIRSS
jgi:hypothetical protein